MRVDVVQRSEVREAGAVLGRALHDDPVFAFLFGPRRARIVRLATTGMLRDCQRFGHVYAARDEAGRIVGVAAWLPPGAFPVTRRRELAGLPSWLAIAALRPSAAPRAVRAVVALDACHPPEEHWFLSMLGVEPSWQGRGAGSRLMAPVLDHAGFAHLDTSKPANLPWYRRFGWEVDHELRVVDGAPPTWALRYGSS